MAKHFAVGFALRLRIAAIVMLCAAHLCITASADDATPGRALVGEEKLKALEMLVTQMKDNFERIQTMRGSYRFEDRFRFGGGAAADAERQGHWETTKGSAVFDLDVRAGKYHVFYNPDASAGRSFRESTHWIFTPEHAWALHFGNGVPWLEDRPPRNNTRIVDVRDFYSNGSPSRSFWEWLNLYPSALRGERSDRERGLVEIGIEVYSSEGPNPEYVIKSTYYSDGTQITTKCDGRAGFNVVSYERINAKGEPTRTRRFRFREVDGIFVPEDIELSLYDEQGQEPRFVAKRKFELQSIEVNVPIPDSTFDIEQFGVRQQ